MIQLFCNYIYLSVTGTLATTVGQINPFRYRGYYYDSETGFYATGTRYYDPVVGRFINADGLVDNGSGSLLATNMVAYCENNPVNFSDPTGTTPQDAANYARNNPMPAFKLFNPVPFINWIQGFVKAFSKPAEPSSGRNFDTIDEAAIDFVLRYGADSISSRCEYTATIYTIDVNGKTMYTYGEPGIGPKRTDYKGKGAWAAGAWDHNVVAYVHTHGHYYGPMNNLFSKTDLNIAKDKSVFAYVGTPGGKVRKYDPWNPGEWDRDNGLDGGFQIYGFAPYDPNRR